MGSIQSPPVPSIVIIGATSGIGLALARELDTANFRLVLCGRRLNLLQQTAKELRNVTAFNAMDVSKTDDAISIMEGIFRNRGPISHVYLSSGVGYLNPSLEWQPEDETILTNALGFAAIASTSMKLFESQGFGHLVGISSVAAERGSWVAPAYNASKAFASSYMQGLRARTKRSRLPIHVTDVRPGFVQTAMMKAEKPFWVSSPEVAARQIIRAVQSKKKLVYVTRRWRIVAFLMRNLPAALYPVVK